MAATIYQPLDPGTRQIRLLILQPSTDAIAPIRGAVNVFDLNDQPEYEAISWFWGDSPSEGSIILNEETKPIRTNMEDALRRFRLLDRTRTLWTDAVCIDQDNEGERAAQIPLMGDIYSTATKTLVWLGRMQSEVENRETFDCWDRLGYGISLRQIIERATGQQLLIGVSDVDLNRQLDQLIGEEQDFMDNKLLDILFDFFELDWWKRLWVLQEVALASEAEIFWGDRMMSFAKLTNAYDGLLQEFRNHQTYIHGILGREEVQEFLDSCEKSMNTAKRLKHIRSQVLPAIQALRDQSLQMIEVLATGRTRNAKKAQDKVFGMLGLLNHTLVREFPVSYQITKEEVYRHTAGQLLTLSETFMLFGCIREPWNLRPGWCPDWNYGYHHVQDLYLRRIQEQIFNSHNAVPWEINVVPDQSEPPTLQVRGFRLDIISRVRGADSDITDSASLYFLLQWFVRFSSNTLFQLSEDIDLERHRHTILNSIYVTGTGLLDAVSRIWFNDCEPLGGHGGIQRLTAQNCTRFRNWFLTADSNLEFSNYNAAAIRAAENLGFEGIDSPSMLDFVRSVIRGKCFFTTRLGYSGLVDYDIQKVDNDPPRQGGGAQRGYTEIGSVEVWVHAGGSQPIVLYPATQRPGHYYVCSEAYVHGVMDGEAARGMTPRLDNNDMHRDMSNQPPEFRIIHLL